MQNRRNQDVAARSRGIPADPALVLRQLVVETARRVAHEQRLGPERPAQVVHLQLGQVLILGHALLDQLPRACLQRAHVLLEALQVGPGGHRPVPGDHGVEVELEDVVQRRHPAQRGPAAGVVDGRHARQHHEQVAGSHHPQVRKIDDRVAVGVAAAHVVQPHLGAAEVDGRFLGVGQRRRAGHRSGAGHGGARVLVADDLCRLEELRVAAGVIAVVVRADHVLHRLVGHALDQSNDLVVVRREHVVHEDHALVRHPHGQRVGAGIEDGVEPRLHLLDGQLCRRRAPLAPAAFTALTECRHDRRNHHQGGQRDFSHARILPKPVFRRRARSPEPGAWSP